MRPSSFLLNQMTKWAVFAYAFFRFLSSPPAYDQEFLTRRRQMLRRRMFRLLRPAARSAFGVQNLRRRALHAAVRAEHAAVAGLGAQHLVTAPALTSQKCRHRGHHHFPLRSAYRAGQDRNLDGSASHCAVNPRQENVAGAPLNPLWQRGVNHALHHAEFCRRRGRASAPSGP